MFWSLLSYKHFLVKQFSNNNTQWKTYIIWGAIIDKNKDKYKLHLCQTGVKTHFLRLFIYRIVVKELDKYKK